MVLKTDKIFVPIFYLAIFCQLFLPSYKANIALQTAMLGIILFLSGKSFSKDFAKSLIPICLIFILGLITYLCHEYKTINLIKDISHFIKPLLGIALGYFLFKKMKFETFVKTIVFAGFVSAIIHFFIILIFGKLGSESINEIRGSFGRDNFLELFSLLFFIFYKKYFKKFLFNGKWLNYVVLFTLAFSNILYFSRTMIISFIIAILTLYGFTKINRKSLKYILAFFLLFGLFYAYLFSIKLERDKPGLEALLYKIKIAPSELFKTRIDRNNHRELWDHWRGYEAKRAFALMEDSPSSYAVGTGFGSLINLKFKAPLDDKGIRYISEIHNGYIYILYKSGIIGLICLFYFLLSLYRYQYRDQNFITILISTIGLIYFFTTLTITGIYNPRDIIIIILGGLIANSESRLNKHTIPEIKNPTVI